MGVKRSQIQNLIIYIGDVFGITIGYFLMSHIRFYPDIYGVWAQDNRVIYRWLVAIFVLTRILGKFQNKLDHSCIDGDSCLFD